MTYLFEKYTIDVNSGHLLPINKAIMHGNNVMIESLILVGKVNFWRVDKTGKSPIHIAGETCNQKILDVMYEKGADLNLPDFDGNTFIHLICEGSVSQEEYNLIVDSFTKYPKLRLTKNKKGQTPFDLIRSYPEKVGVQMKGMDNMRRKLWDYFEGLIERNPDVIDPS